MGLLSKDKRAERKERRKARREDRRSDGTRLKQFLLNPSPYKNPKQNKNK
jgi:hypothetical protein